MVGKRPFPSSGKFFLFVFSSFLYFDGLFWTKKIDETVIFEKQLRFKKTLWNNGVKFCQACLAVSKHWGTRKPSIKVEEEKGRQGDAVSAWTRALCPAKTHLLCSALTKVLRSTQTQLLCSGEQTLQFRFYYIKLPWLSFQEIGARVKILLVVSIKVAVFFFRF